MESLERLPTSMLICCTTNALRSAMAEGMVRFLRGRAFCVSSAGVRVGTLDQFAVAVMDEIGIDISGHCPKDFHKVPSGSFDLIVSLSPEAQHHMLNFKGAQRSQLIFWNTFDPSATEGNREVRLSAYRAVRDTLFNRLKGYFIETGMTVPPPNIWE